MPARSGTLCVVITMTRHHTEIRRYRIFALVLGDKVFVGSTSAARLSAVYSRHRTSSVAATRGIFDLKRPPAMHVLEQLDCTGSDAYRHTLAWIHLFEEGGFTSTNHGRTAAAADLLYPRTEEILQNLPRQPIGEILERTHLKKPADGDRKEKKAGIFQPKPEKTVQMNLRMSPKDRTAFRRFAKEHHLHSREALGLLLDQAMGNDVHLKKIQSAHEKELAALRRSYEKALNNTNPRADAFLSFLRPGLSDYLRQIIPMGKPLPTMPYQRFRRQLPPGVHYDTPQEEGFLLLKPEWILWGRKHSKFIAGRGEQGELFRLRSYDRPLYAGLKVTTAGWWLVGCQRAADGAMEIAAAFPLPPLAAKSEVEQPQASKQALNDLIHQAQSRKST